MAGYHGHFGGTTATVQRFSESTCRNVIYVRQPIMAKPFINLLGSLYEIGGGELRVFRSYDGDMRQA